MTNIGSPIGPLTQALYEIAKDDTTLATLATGGVFDALPRETAPVPPYVTFGRRDVFPAASGMQLDTHRLVAVIDVWSAKNGASEVTAILSRLRQLFGSHERTLSVFGYTVIGGSLRCTAEHVLPDTDPDMPDEKSLYHGVQIWEVEAEDAA